MVQQQNPPPFKGKTYSLYGGGNETDRYYSTIRDLTDLFLKRCPDEKNLLHKIQRAGSNRPFKSRFLARGVDKPLISFVRKTLRETLPIYTTGVKEHLKTMPLRQRFDSILRTKREQYHLYMIEIELVNRIYKEAFRQSKYRFALIAHCLRDFRPDCRSVSGDIEAICRNCTKECFINIGSLLLKKYGIHPYISVTMDFETLFRKLKSEHKSVGALGIGCVPELAQGMRLCIKLGLSPVGIPLDANRCARWMKEARESSFNLRELEELIK
jgi:hypothetical protein